MGRSFRTRFRAAWSFERGRLLLLFRKTFFTKVPSDQSVLDQPGQTGRFRRTIDCPFTSLSPMSQVSLPPQVDPQLPQAVVVASRPLSARALLRKQQRTATLVSLVVALLLMVMMGLILALIFMAVESTSKPTLVAYSGVPEPEERITPPKVQTSVDRKPSAPSLAASKMIVANSSSPTAVPVPMIEVEDISMEMGVGNDFGQGWGDGNGFGSGGGSSFFGQTSRAERIAYVIDFSSSMKGQDRHKIMRDELCESLQKMENGLQIGMVFFGGPAWVAGDEIKMGQGRKEAVVTAKGGKKFKWKSNGGAHNWEPDGPKQKVPWHTIDDREVKRLQKIVRETPLFWGTIWDHPLHMALDMDPTPQTIYFMTDGSASGSAKWAQEIGKKAKKMGVVINCVALMHPKAKEDLQTIADMTGGQLTMVNEKGERVQIK